MVADRVVLLPSTHIGRHTIMGSGALGKRDTTYADGSTWIGCGMCTYFVLFIFCSFSLSDSGEAVCFSHGTKETSSTSDTTTPFGRAFYEKQVDYFVYPYPMILLINIIMTSISSVYWSLGAVSTSQVLTQIHLHTTLNLFAPRWYRFAVIYGFIAVCFITLLIFQVILAIIFVILSKWLLIGQREAGQYSWDQSSYCQRWKLHLTLSRILSDGYGRNGVLSCITSSAYIVWYYRALGAKIGKNCSVWASGQVGLMTEPDLVEVCLL